MATEIERKFLVTDRPWKSEQRTYYCQGYLNRDKHRTVRVRIAGSNAWLTVKSLTTGTTRLEFEYAIPVDDAEQLLELCDRPLIKKWRYVVEHAGMTWEVDEFLGDNQGLVVAEIELPSEHHAFEKPDWVGEEVTFDPRYFNANLSRLPFQSWPQASRSVSDQTNRRS